MGEYEIMKKITVSVLMLLALSAALLSTTVAQNQAGYTTASNVAGNSNITATANASMQIKPQTTTDVTKLANVTAIFGPNKAEDINITQVNTAGGMWIGVVNEGIVTNNLSGWRLENRESLIYAIPNINLYPGSILRIHEGSGMNNITDLYTNSTSPLFSKSGDVIRLLGSKGEIAAEYNISGNATASATTPTAAPLLVNATTPTAVKNPATQPVLITPGAPNVVQNPANAPVLINNPLNPLQANATGNQTCIAGQTLCNGTCTDTSVDSQNCGKCGNICPADSHCINGVCSSSCLPGQTSCNGNCVDTSADSQNCGSCGDVCPANAVCISGVCSAYPTPGAQ